MTTTTDQPWRVEVFDVGNWVNNGVRFPWLGEAWQYGLDLQGRWTGAARFRVMHEGDESPWADSDCRGCYEAAKGGMYPTHHVSPGCDHQQQPHCTGDGCF